MLAPTSPKKGAATIAVVAAIVAALLAFVLPKKQLEANKSPAATQPDAFKRA